MKVCSKILMMFLLMIGGPVFAQEIAGTWQGKLAIAPNQTITIQFVLTKRSDGSYAAILNSPDNSAIKNMAANAVTWNAGALKIDVTALSGSYAGTYKNGNFDGQWTQPGGRLPLILSPKPALSKEAIKTLLGAWNGPLPIPGQEKLTLVTRFKLDDRGVLQGAIAVPEYQAGKEAAMSDIEFADNKLMFRVPEVRGTFKATYAKGIFTGTWSQGNEVPVTLTQGDVVAPAAPVIPLKLSKESYAALAGRWQGEIQLPQSLLHITLRVEKTSKGEYVGYLDNPVQSAMGLPVSEITLNAGKMTFKLERPPAEFSGTLSEKTITGEWLQRGVVIPVTLTKQ